jgi:predicted regulator of Ras-like GTPase activity (Roadblock/LC7/MglB family)
VNDVFANALQRLSRIPGVRGAMIVDGAAGIPVVAEMAEGIAAPAVAALAASLFRRTARAAEAADFGALGMLQLEAEEGHVVIAGTPELAVVAVAEEGAPLGLVRLELQKAAQALR